MKLGRQAIAVTAATALVTAAFVVPHLHLGIVRPLLHPTPRWIELAGNAEPLYGVWKPHIGWGTIPAVLIGIAAVLSGPGLARRLPWHTLTLTTWATSAAWAFCLAVTGGWQREFGGRIAPGRQYVAQVHSVTDIPAAVRGFSSHILDFQPNSWITHVSGHPPGALLTFVWLQRIGLGGGIWAGWLCLIAGSSAAAAVIVTVRALTDENTARLAAPFVALAPTAIWIAVADGYFAAVAAWGVALLALAATRAVRFPVAAAIAAGLLLGWALFLNYGLTLIALPVIAVLIAAKNTRAALTAVAAAIPATAAVVAVFATAGFCWFDGYTLVQQRYWQGIASQRPFQYWSWANLASVVCAIGLGSVAGLTKAFNIAAIKQRCGLHLLLLASLLAIICADLSMLSKAETERIWLPFMVWLTAAPALLPPSTHRWWLGVNIVGALLISHLFLTNW